MCDSIEPVIWVRQCVERMGVEAGARLCGTDSAYLRCRQIWPMFQQEDGRQWTRLGNGRAGKRARRDMNSTRQMYRGWRQRVGIGWLAFQTYRMRISKDPHGWNIDGAQLIAQVIKSVVQDSPGRG